VVQIPKARGRMEYLEAVGGQDEDVEWTKAC